MIEPSGNFESLDDVGGVTVQIPDKAGQVIYLQDIATIRRSYVDPPDSPAFFNGKQAVVLSVSMLDQYDASQFGEDLDNHLQSLKAQLPIGFTLDYITFQPKEIETAVFGV